MNGVIHCTWPQDEFDDLIRPDDKTALEESKEVIDRFLSDLL